ncbi:MAG: FGGY-family carbohydrate kinase [Candidatus Cyclobacteriaceae bacterium M3_2C_046]
MEQNYFAILDVGKTNKKILIYDEDLKIVDSSFKVFPEITENEILSDDIEAIGKWFIQELKHFAQSYSIKVISVTTHGATFVCLDKQGNLAVPEVSYTHDPGPGFDQKFYQQFGDSISMQQSTATPDFSALINIAKGIYFVREKYPEQFKQVDKILNYPQYFGYLLTGKAGAEPTYIGCHTYLWDFHRKNWSAVAQKLGVYHLLPQKISHPWDVLGKVKPEIAGETGLSEETLVTLGIHDSNASLMPYIISGQGNFVLNSTGTWCVVMRQAEQVHFNQEDLGKIVFYNLSAFNQPVKTAIFLGGLEFDTYSKILREINQREDFPAYDQDVYQQVVKNQREFILPSITRGTGQFPESAPRVIEGDNVYDFETIEQKKDFPDFFKDYEYAMAVLNISLALQTQVALQRVGVRDGMNIFTEGGFRKNIAYNAVLTSLYPASEVATTNLNEATAFGAALLAKAALTGQSPNQLKEFFEIEKELTQPVTLKGLAEYSQKFHYFIDT